MFGQAEIRKPEQTREMKSSYCKNTPKVAEEVVIPESWGLSALQRDFIESMIEKKSN
ncbi:hypothetical protein [Erwinia sp. V71]|uniref:hypothetical protein n=1 Tax=Erwinia sp. V71 TaxID=3369424 RepID=UPI003F6321F4